MKRLFIIIALFVFKQPIIAQTSQKLAVSITTWDSVRVSGKLSSINDSVITITSSKPIDNGKVYQFPATKVKNLKIWKKGNNIPFIIVGAAALGVLGGSITEKGNGQTAAILTGSAVGAVVGLTGSNLFFTRVNKRGLHLTDFKRIRQKL